MARKTTLEAHKIYTQGITSNWNAELYNTVVKNRITSLKKVRVSRHTIERINDKTKTNRNFTVKDITRGLTTGNINVVEFEAEETQYGHIIHKVIIDIERENNKPITCAVVFHPTHVFVVTAWENTKKKFSTKHIAKVAPRNIKLANI